MSSMALPSLRRIEEGTASNRVEGTTRRGAASVDPLAQVVAGCRRRDPEAQRELVLRTQDRVYRSLVRLVGAQDAEDVAQEVYMHAFRRIHQFHGDSSLSTWLYRITVNEALQHLRKKRRRPWTALDWDPEERTANRHGQSETRELLDQALAQIEPGLRSLFVLREVEGLSYEAIGAALRIPTGTVASRLSRARHDLQQRLRSLGWTG